MDILEDINSSPSPYHAVETQVKILKEHGFKQLNEKDDWDLSSSGRYFVVRDFSSLIAFVNPGKNSGEIPHIRIGGAHTDSPTLKLKSKPLKFKKEMLVWDIEIYGSPIITTWFDRDLSLAGLVGYLDGSGEIRHTLVNFKNAITRIPHLAIHLNREVNKGYAPNLHEEINPIFGLINKKGVETSADNSPDIIFKSLLKKQLLENKNDQQNDIQILDWDLSFYDVQPTILSGLDKQWIVGARLDNLLSCFAGTRALVDYAQKGGKNSDTLAILACFDHEEVGSVSSVGADSNFAESVLRRVVPDQKNFDRAMAQTRMLSVDNAHACHPNFPSKQDESHCPALGGGLVIKRNNSRRYTTDVISGSWFKALCLQEGIKTEYFSMRADMPCGSTIGPMLSSKLGLSSIDIGVPTWAMHSIRETAGVNDFKDLYKVWKAFYGSQK
ncbi:MAG: M18 family aminopeptidase [Magnetococcales bacterium]|nr:M18 family aminopeptidase [Magnetococcales bacterium]